MSLELEIEVGRTLANAGSKVTPPGGQGGEQLVGSLYAKYWTAVRNGQVFSGAIGAAGLDHGAAIDTTAILSLHTPTGSGKRLVILRASLSYISGTLGAGTLF